MNGHETTITTAVSGEETVEQQPQQQQQQKELALFAGLNDGSFPQSLIYLELIDDSSSSHNNSLSRTSTSSSYAQSQSTLDYESSCEEERFGCGSTGQQLNEQAIKERLKSNAELSEQIQNLYVLYGNRSILAVVARTDPPLTTTSINELANTLIVALGVPLQRRPVPYTPAANANQTGLSLLASYDTDTTSSVVAASSLVLVSEVTDRQLSLVASDKSEALKIIESKTGLRLKKIKKSIYFTGVLFQFVLLNAIIADRMRQLALAAALLAEKTKKENAEKAKENDQQQQQLSSTNSTVVVSTRSPGIDWTEYYLKSERRLQFRLKSTHLPSFAYDCYIFQSDLTDLNCDALVNASNASLHPGYNYSGDVVSVARRIREKGGKQMQDSLKKILLQLAPAKLNDSDVVMTKSHGRLKSRYVLHAVTPTWSKYVLEKQNVAEFEPRMEETLHNVLRKAHDPSLELRSIAFPVASPLAGGAFDMPVRLFAHLLYLALATFELDEAAMNLELTKVCVCSVEPQIVDELCSVFAAYSEMCEQTSWALPESPMNALVHEIYPNEFDLLKVVAAPSSPSPPPSPPFSSELSLDEKPSQSSSTTTASSATVETHDDTTLSNTSMGDMSSILDATTAILTGNNMIGSNNEYEQHNNNMDENATTMKSTVVAVANNSNSSDESAATSSDEHQTPPSSSSLPPQSTTQSIPIPTPTTQQQQQQSQQQQPQQQKQQHNDFCLFCQREKNLFTCGNESCTSAFCSRCISHHFKQQSLNNSAASTMNKCPGCKQMINNRNLLTRIGIDHNSSATATNNYSFSSTSSSSSSLSISPVRFQQAHHQLSSSAATSTNQMLPTGGRRFRDSGGSNHSSVGSVGGSGFASSSGAGAGGGSGHLVKYPFCDAKIYIRKVDQPCEGYEDFKSILITFDAPDGIQNNQHPKPGQPYKGTIKRAYLPEIKEHLEILAFYERALKAGMLFKIDFVRSYNEYRVLLNQDVILKTNSSGGGKFGYPDTKYIDSLLKMARNFSSSS